MAYITCSDGTQIYYNDWGNGIPVVLISGWPLSSASWEYQARFLAENGYRVISYDRRGFGKSDRAFEGYHYEILTQDLAAIIENLELEQVTLVGFSMGGGELARYISKYNDHMRVTKAVLIGSITPFLLKTATNLDGIDQLVFDEMIQQIEQDRPAFLKELSKKFFSRSLINHSVSDAILEYFVYLALDASPKATIDLVRAWSATDFRNDLHAFNIPTLIIHGSNDLLVPATISSARSIRIINNAIYHEYEGEPHGLCFTASKRLNQDLLNFIK